MDRLAIFNYMIGNYDWSIPGQHNVIVLKSLSFDPYGLGIAIPHDFDWTGLVNASYAIRLKQSGQTMYVKGFFWVYAGVKRFMRKILICFQRRKRSFIG